MTLEQEEIHTDLAAILGEKMDELKHTNKRLAQTKLISLEKKRNTLVRQIESLKTVMCLVIEE